MGNFFLELLPDLTQLHVRARILPNLFDRSFQHSAGPPQVTFAIRFGRLRPGGNIRHDGPVFNPFPG